MSAIRVEVKGEQPTVLGIGFIPIETSPEFIALRELSLQPGNLVHGVTIATDQLQSELQKGLLRCAITTARRFTHTFLAFALLSKEPLPQRYQQAHHHGPKIESKVQSQDDLNFTVVCSREKLLAKFPGQLAAVGPYFWNDYFANAASQYVLNERDEFREVYGIPIGRPLEEIVPVHRADAWDDPYGDEVDLYIRRDQDGLIVPQSCWSAIIIPEARWPELEKHAHLLPPVPVFNTTCDRLNLSLIAAYNISDYLSSH